ncbi:GH92 family glycosyl hydrolase [Cellulosimicrobium marinum]|uniref:GH92 family glycosyl hydrolase n=1 Tax=Cellulosimicrobium marinum TaxID=1638992 RepID=UPI001E3100D0|nr:GH92 family glycosyl hydrolase [Cellulosimicrobium marinum]MCB7135086.1 GH92 family glycosyl hydrolase [Cellulosimicrobium marinum]
MTHPPVPARAGSARPAGGRPRPWGVALAAALAVPLAVPVGSLTALPAAAAEPGDFATSFEESDAAPLESTVAQRDGAPWQSNIAAATSGLPGSVLGSLGAVTASAQNLPNEGAAKLADGSASSKWLAFASTGWVVYEFAEPVAIEAYALTSANDSAGRDPKNWTIEASDDGSTWTAVDQRTDEDFPQRFQQRVFELDEPTQAHRYYRLNITANSGDGIVQLAEWDLSADLDAPPAEAPMTTEVGTGPSVSFTNKAGVGFTGTHSLRYDGSHLGEGEANATNVLYDDVEVTVGEDTRLSWKIFPELLDDLQYPSTFASVDLEFTDGTYLSDLDATDAHGTGASAQEQGEGKILYADQWNSVRVDLGDVAAGKTVDKVLIGYDNPGGEAGTQFAGWLDDVAIEAQPPVIDGSSLANYVDTRRGTHATGSFSRGNNIPATAVPNGFNFWVPFTNADSQSWLYEYHKGNNANNKPVLEGFGISHEPSPWMGDRNQLTFLPSTATGTPSGTLSQRGLEFDHADETARPDYYGVTFTNDSALEATPTDHGAVLRFTFPGDVGHVLVDKVDGSSTLTFDQATGTLSGWVENGSGLSVGRTRMFVTGTFDRGPTAVGTAAGNRADARFATFDTSSDDTVELRVATSFISLDQARANLAQEVEGRTFTEVKAAAADAWNDRLGVVEVEGASEDELVTLYSNLYRLNLYPNSQFENTGTVDEPVYEYASPVSATTGSATDTTTNAKVVEGKIYVNNGFWDTYRTAWPAYSLLYPELAGELIDGFVEQYRDGGWIARWSSPGYADLMTGTSSDVAFADAYLKGSLDTDVALEAYDAALKNATVSPPNNAVGRKGLQTSPFLGFTPESTHESVSWGLEGLVNDFGIGNMAAALAEDPATPDERRDALREESAYFLERATHYVELFDADVDFFVPRHADGEFAVDPETYDPAAWGGGYTETNGWNFAFHAPQDPQGLANLYGGKEGLEAKLDAFFSTPELGAGSGGIHEQREARDVRMGMWGMSNQVSHHIPWLYDAAGAPSKTQSTVREVTRRLFTGSEIGQGYPGDEDNGEMSSWWLFSALGFYPLQVGSAEYAVGSPLFDKATVHLPDGDLVVNAANNSVDNVYVQSLAVDGEAVTSTSLSQEDLSGGATLDFVMGPEPSDWGTGEDDAPPSLTEGDEAPEPVQDATTAGLGTTTVADGDASTGAAALVDNTSGSRTTFATSTPTVTWSGNGIRPTVGSYTLTSGASGTASPAAWTLEGSDDGETWTTLDERSGEEFHWALQTRPFTVAEPGAYAHYRVAVTATAGGTSGAALSLAEVELLADPSESGADELTLTAAADRDAVTGREVEGTFATLTGVEDGDPSGLAATVSFGDGSEPVEATLVEGSFGAWAVRAAHTWDAAGVYPVTVTVTPEGGEPATATTHVSVSLLREGSLLAAYDNVCIGDLGTTLGSCDGQGVFFDRAQLEEKGVVQGERIDVPGTDLRFDLPAVPAGEPDNATGDGQTVELDLPADAEQLSVIGTGTEKNQQASGTLTFDDGSTQAIDLSFGDWSGAARNPVYGNIAVAVTDDRLRGGSPQTGTPAAMFATAPVDLPEGKRAVSLTLPDQPGELSRDGRIHVFAVAHDGTFADHAPLEVTAAEGVSVGVGQETDTVLATVAGGREGADLTAAITWGDGSDVAAGTVADGTVTGAHAYAETGTYTAYVVVDDGWTSQVVEVPVTVTDAAPTLDVEVTTSTRCLAGKAYVAVRATNGEDVPLAIRLVTPYGSKQYASVQPGASAYQSFATRATEVDAGTVTVEAVRGAGDEEVTASLEAGYDAVSCG